MSPPELAPGPADQAPPAHGSKPEAGDPVGELAAWRCAPVGPDKVPLLRGWPEKATADRATWRTWLARWPRAALALATGPSSGVLVLDVDAPTGGRPDGFAALAELERELGPLPATATAASPSGGEHRFFRWPAGRDRIPSRPIRPGLDCKASSGLVTLPCGARTPGRRWLAHPADGLAELPASWLAALLPPPPPPPPPRPVMVGDRRLARTLARLADRVRAARPGERHVTLTLTTRAVGGLVPRGLDPELARAELLAAALAAGLDRREAEETIAWGLRVGAEAPLPMPEDRLPLRARWKLARQARIRAELGKGGAS